jgi:hypothetical protein
MTMSDRRHRPEPQPERSSVAVIDRPAQQPASYYDPDASSFDDVRDPELTELLATTTSIAQSVELLGVSRS